MKREYKKIRVYHNKSENVYVKAHMYEDMHTFDLPNLEWEERLTLMVEAHFYRDKELFQFLCKVDYTADDFLKMALGNFVFDRELSLLDEEKREIDLLNLIEKAKISEEALHTIESYYREFISNLVKKKEFFLSSSISFSSLFEEAVSTIKESIITFDSSKMSLEELERYVEITANRLIILTVRNQSK